MTSTDALFAAERIKWHKSWVLLTVLLAPFCQTAFLTVIFWFSESRLRMFRPGFQFWLELNFVLWNLVLMPLVAGLVCELSWEQEREARAWNLLLTQPVPRPTHFLVKVLSHFTLMLIAQGLLSVLLLLGGLLLQRNPDLLMGSLPLALFIRFTGYSTLAFIPVVVFHTWLAMRIPGLWVSLATALAGSWFTMKLVGGSALIQFLPWGLASHLPIMFERWRVLPWALVPGSLLAAGVFIALGARDFSRHRESRS